VGRGDLFLLHTAPRVVCVDVFVTVVVVGWYWKLLPTLIYGFFRFFIICFVVCAEWRTPKLAWIKLGEP
jgi:hypothetical protein